MYVQMNELGHNPSPLLFVNEAAYISF